MSMGVHDFDHALYFILAARHDVEALRQVISDVTDVDCLCVPSFLDKVRDDGND